MWRGPAAPAATAIGVIASDQPRSELVETVEIAARVLLKTVRDRETGVSAADPIRYLAGGPGLAPQ
ncbi:hypothetical protein, partial [Nocardia sp. 852002-20019_SCH5090214]|uniref:hypothetical protein n=1 Tax=Nocardia sp. 852002-20019_SCH5090214 TaxID=1834087 RepID=UPI001E5C1D3D